MYEKIRITASEVEAFTFQQKIALYCEALNDANKYEDYEPIKAFKRLFPEDFRLFSSVSRKRREIRKSIEAMEVLGGPIYWGTLTYNNAKNLNKEEIKRKEAFERLNSVFEYVLLVEEYGGENGRFHVHFLGVFKENENFDSFRLAWSHSRQELRQLSEQEDIAKYLIKYLIKDLPRLRRNKNLTGLIKRFKACEKVEKYPWTEPLKKAETWARLGDFVASRDKS